MRSISTTRRNSSGVVSSRRAKRETAARCTQVSSRPYVSAAVSATAFTCSKSVTSAATAVGSPPRPRISCTRESSPSSFRAETTTFAPLSANRRAVSRPIPLEAPISATTCSSTGFSFITTPSGRDKGVCSPLSKISFLVEKVAEDTRELAGALDVGQVAVGREHALPPLLEPAGCVSGLSEREEPVSRAPHYERRRREVGEPLQQHLPLPPRGDPGPRGAQRRL